jgi:hypothetical protein
MNRNIKTMQESSAARAALAKSGRPELDGGLATEEKPDKWYESLTKAIPAEALSLYIALSAIVMGANMEPKTATLYFAAIVLICIVFNTLYLKLIWKISKVSQIVASCFALLVYVYANGGRLVESLAIHDPVIGSLMLVTTAAFLALFPIYGGSNKPKEGSTELADGTSAP